MSYPVLGVLICTVLLTRVDFSQSAMLATTIGIALLNWLAVPKLPLANDA
jgi:hypothetical protein